MRPQTADRRPQTKKRNANVLAVDIGNTSTTFGAFHGSRLVEKFQVRHWEQVLKPWVPYGLATDHTPTGYVYKTTKRWINMLHCKELELAMPQLP